MKFFLKDTYIFVHTWFHENFFKNFKMTFSREINCAEIIVQLQIYFYPIVSSTMSSIIRHSMYTSPQETKITLVFFLVVHISILIWLLWKLKHQYQYDCTVRAWISCIITNHSNQSTLFKAIIGQAHMTALKKASLIKIFWLLHKTLLGMRGWGITNFIDIKRRQEMFFQATKIS